MSYKYIYGCGGHAKVLLDVLVKADPLFWESLIFVDDHQKKDFLGRPVVKPEAIASIARVYLAIGDNRVRMKVFDRLSEAKDKLLFPKAFAKTAVIGNTPGAVVYLGSGVHILSHTYIGPDSTIGSFTIINNGASVDHDCSIGDFSHIAPGVRLCGNVSVGSRTLIGVGTSVIPSVDIGSDCIIGAGSVVVSDIPDGVIAYGNPCKVIKENHQLHY